MKKHFTLFLLLFTLTSYSQNIYEGLVAYYPFSNNADDQSEFSHHGQVFGASLTEDRFGTPNSAYDFNGTDNFIRVEHSEEFNFGTNAPYSLSIWFLASEIQEELTVPGNDVLSKWFIDGNETQSAGYSLVLRYNNQIAENPFIMRALRFDGYGGGCVNSQAVGTEIVKEVWHHVVFTFDENGVFNFYYDNTLVGTQSENVVCSTQNESPLLIGKRGAAPHPNHFTGKIDDIRIYQRSITEEEIQILYEENLTSHLEDIDLVNFVIYPNPANSSINLDIPTSVQVQNIKIVDIMGRTVKSQDWNIGQKIETEHISSGVYFLVLENEKGQIIGRKKFVKVSNIRA